MNLLQCIRNYFLLLISKKLNYILIEDLVVKMMMTIFKFNFFFLICYYYNYNYGSV